MRFPAGEYTAPWHGQINAFFPLTHGTVQPRCGHMEERTHNCPWLSFVTYTVFSEIALRHPSTRSIWMGRATGWLNEENSLSEPIGDGLTSVVGRSKGKSAKANQRHGE